MDIWLIILFTGWGIQSEYKHNKLKQELSKKNEALDNEIISLHVKISELEKEIKQLENKRSKTYVSASHPY